MLSADLSSAGTIDIKTAIALIGAISAVLSAVISGLIALYNSKIIERRKLSLLSYYRHVDILVECCIILIDENEKIDKRIQSLSKAKLYSSASGNKKLRATLESIPRSVTSINLNGYAKAIEDDLVEFIKKTHN